MDIFDAYGFQNQVENVAKEGNLKESLKLLGIVYFDGSLEKGNENIIVFEFSKVAQWQSRFDLWKRKYDFGAGEEIV